MKTNEIEKLISDFGYGFDTEYGNKLRRKLRALARKAFQRGVAYGMMPTKFDKHNADIFEKEFGIKP